MRGSSSDSISSGPAGASARRATACTTGSSPTTRARMSTSASTQPRACGAAPGAWGGATSGSGRTVPDASSRVGGFARRAHAGSATPRRRDSAAEPLGQATAKGELVI
jgi:hypothetical protein